MAVSLDRVRERRIPEAVPNAAKRRVRVPGTGQSVSPWMVAAAGVGVAAALGGVAWRALGASGDGRESPESHAAATASSVANAARAHVIEELESAANAGPDTIERAAREAVQEAASAGADVVAAALGAVEGTGLAHEATGIEPAQARRLAAEGALQAARGIGAAAATRVRQVLRRDLEGGDLPIQADEGA